jgi:hypothetical protein
LNNNPIIKLEVVDLKMMTDEIKLWFSKLQYLEVDDLRKIIQIMDNHLKSLNEKETVKISNSNKISFKNFLINR